MESKNAIANAQLASVYRQWLNELEKNAPKLLAKYNADPNSQNYSNPYFISVPDGWFGSESRIMVVGEEGFGERGNRKKNNEISAEEVEKIQMLNYNYLKDQLDPAGTKKNNSPFWRRLRKVSGFGICSWTNIDKIHLLHSKKCSLCEKDRKMLHSTNTKLLRKEIEILQPTCVVFFGWYGISLKEELPEVFEKMYPGGLGDSSVWFKRVVSFQMDGRDYLFSYHPSWGYRKAGYEDKVIEELKKITARKPEETGFGKNNLK